MSEPRYEVRWEWVPLAPNGYVGQWQVWQVLRWPVGRVCYWKLMGIAETEADAQYAVTRFEAEGKGQQD